MSPEGTGGPAGTSQNCFDVRPRPPFCRFLLVDALDNLSTYTGSVEWELEDLVEDEEEEEDDEMLMGVSVRRWRLLTALLMALDDDEDALEAAFSDILRRGAASSITDCCIL